MGRPAEFDRDAVLDAAMHVFWRKGFEATSVSDLVVATGLNRGSLYNAFTDKAGLFQAVMGHYAAHAPSRALIEAAKSAPPRATIEAFFSALVRRAHDDLESKGCLITNTAAELCARDPAMNAWIGEALVRVENAMRTLVKRGRKDGTITSKRPARALARFLVCGAQGMLVLSKAGYSSDALGGIADITLVALD